MIRSIYRSSLGNALGRTLRYTSQPPDFVFWGASRGESDDEEMEFELKMEPDGDEYEGPEDPDTHELGWWRGFRRIPLAATGAEIDALFYPEHDPKGIFGSPGVWFRGKIVFRKIEMGQLQWDVEFEDGDKGTYPDEDFRNNYDVRVLSSPNCKIIYVGAGSDPHEEGTGRTGKLSDGPGPWQIWLRTYLQDLLLSIFRAARRNAEIDQDHLFGILHLTSA